MGPIKYCLVLFLIYVKNCVSENEFAELCDNIFFKQPNYSATLALKEIINGVYIKTIVIVDNFPVYKHERGNAYFQYSRSSNKFYFSSGNIGKNTYIGLGADGDSYKMREPQRWVKESGRRTDNIFGGIIRKWFQWQYPPTHTRNTYLTSEIIVKCVNFTDCGFRDLVFTQSYGGNLSVDVFKPLDNVYSFNRQSVLVFPQQLLVHRIWL